MFFRHHTRRPRKEEVGVKKGDTNECIIYSGNVHRGNECMEIEIISSEWNKSYRS